MNGMVVSFWELMFINEGAYTYLLFVLFVRF